MRLDGFGVFVDDMGAMIRFYRNVMGFEIKECEDTSNVYLIKDSTLFLLYGRNDFENMTSRKYEYIKGFNGHCKRCNAGVRLCSDKDTIAYMVIK